MSKLKTQIELTKILKEIINEVGDLENIIPYKFQMDSEGLAYFRDEDGDVVVMFVEELGQDQKAELSKVPKVFEVENNPAIDVGYKISGVLSQYKKSTYSKLMRILKTFSIYLKEEIGRVEKKYPNLKPLILIAAQSKNREEFADDAQKFNLYRQLVMKNIPKNYRISQAEVLGKKVIVAQKLKQKPSL